ncbi:hypothetical protein F5X99DRAFT_407794 [Biscogniauxia marginata]|nr:hypothetical protein F5X99DRAFT_407794 [Biscogniauxia marginata]
MDRPSHSPSTIPSTIPEAASRRQQSEPTPCDHPGGDKINDALVTNRANHYRAAVSVGPCSTASADDRILPPTPVAAGEVEQPATARSSAGAGAGAGAEDGEVARPVTDPSADASEMTPSATGGLLSSAVGSRPGPPLLELPPVALREERPLSGLPNPKYVRATNAAGKEVTCSCLERAGHRTRNRLSSVAAGRALPTTQGTLPRPSRPLPAPPQQRRRESSQPEYYWRNELEHYSRSFSSLTYVGRLSTTRSRHSRWGYAGAFPLASSRPLDAGAKGLLPSSFPTPTWTRFQASCAGISHTRSDTETAWTEAYAGAGEGPGAPATCRSGVPCVTRSVEVLPSENICPGGGGRGGNVALAEDKDKDKGEREGEDGRGGGGGGGIPTKSHI